MVLFLYSMINDIEEYSFLNPLNSYVKFVFFNITGPFHSLNSFVPSYLCRQIKLFTKCDLLVLYYLEVKCDLHIQLHIETSSLPKF
jgi:hypothetical protein